MARAIDWPPMATEATARWSTRPFKSLRSRLTLLAMVVVALMLVTTSLGLVAAQRRLLTRGLDEALRQRADNIEPGLARRIDAGSLPTEGDREDSFLQILDGRGRVIASSSNARRLPAATPPQKQGAPQATDTVSRPLNHGDFRVLARSVRSGPRSYTLVVARNLDDVNESVRILTRSLALTIPVIVSLLAALVWWLTGRALRPVQSIRAEVASIQGAELHRRVPVPSRDDEIAGLARTMNGMLDRVEDVYQRQRGFVADASHELRGPLTRIRTDLELSIAHPETDRPTATFQRLLADATELQQLLDDLLLLARSEADPNERREAPVDLDDLVIEEARRLRDRHRVKVDTSGVTAARVGGDRNQLARAVRNLADNAERHAATTVTFELGENRESSELVVADDGPGIPTEHHARVFERFSRLDQARSRDTGGCGLGLAIVRDVVVRHGGTIVIASTDGTGARFVMTLPKAD